MNSTSSRCNRLKMTLTGPAFSLATVEQHTENCNDQLVSAAAVEKMSEIYDFLVLGSWKDASNVELLRSQHVTHVLNVAKEVPTAEDHLNINSAGFIHCLIPMLDSHGEDITQHFDKAFDFIEEARRANGKVLVHCRRGISRSPAVVVGYVMRYHHQQYNEAVEFVKSRRKCVSLNLAFRQVLEGYHPDQQESGGQSGGGVSCSEGGDFLTDRFASTVVEDDTTIEVQQEGGTSTTVPDSQEEHDDTTTTASLGRTNEAAEEEDDEEEPVTNKTNKETQQQRSTNGGWGDNSSGDDCCDDEEEDDSPPSRAKTSSKDRPSFE